MEISANTDRMEITNQLVALALQFRFKFALLGLNRMMQQLLNVDELFRMFEKFLFAIEACF
jgi:uncharacterized membrane protein (DUF373 family)